MKKPHWYSFFWVFGILMFGSSISDMISAQKLDTKTIILSVFALAAWLHGLYYRYKKFKSDKTLS